MNRVTKRGGALISPERKTSVTRRVRVRVPCAQAQVLSIALVALLLLGVVVLADYLLDDGEVLRWNDAGEVASDKDQSAGSEGKSGEGAPAGDEATGEPNPTVLLGEYFTDYAWDPDEGRQSNLRTASEAIDGTLVAPGEEFSTLAKLTPLEYKPAKVFANGGVDYEVGGGRVGLSKLHGGHMPASDRGAQPALCRRPTFGPASTRWCVGATTRVGELHMRFKNTTDGSQDRESQRGGFSPIPIYGEEPTGKVVRMDTEKVEEDLGRDKWATTKMRNGTRSKNGLRQTVYVQTPRPREIKHEGRRPRARWVTSNTTSGTTGHIDRGQRRWPQGLKRDLSIELALAPEGGGIRKGVAVFAGSALRGELAVGEL